MSASSPADPVWVEQGDAGALSVWPAALAPDAAWMAYGSGNVWLDPEKTSPYTLYQFWVKQADAEVRWHVKGIPVGEYAVSVLASGMIPVGPTAWLVWPFPLYPWGNERISRQRCR